MTSACCKQIIALDSRYYHRGHNRNVNWIEDAGDRSFWGNQWWKSGRVNFSLLRSALNFLKFAAGDRFAGVPGVDPFRLQRFQSFNTAVNPVPVRGQ